MSRFWTLFFLAAHLSAVAQTLHFTTSVMKLAVRQPVIVAKQLASLAVITGNRFSFGVGISPWQEDYTVTQVPWSKRGQRMDEMVEILNGLMRGGYFAYHGEIFNIPEVKISPVPSQPIPILIGGHSPAALKRAARLGDGWISAGGTFEDIQLMISKINTMRHRYKRDHLPFSFSVAAAEAFSADGIKRLKDIGVDEVTLAFRNVYEMEADTKSVEEKIDTMKWYADEVIAKSR